MTITRRGLMLVLSSPSGAGKTTLSRRLLDADLNIVLSVSITTRAKRPTEKEGAVADGGGSVGGLFAELIGGNQIQLGAGTDHAAEAVVVPEIDEPIG